jgi:hypothetical protein
MGLFILACAKPSMPPARECGQTRSAFLVSAACKEIADRANVLQRANLSAAAANNLQLQS